MNDEINFFFCTFNLEVSFVLFLHIYILLFISLTIRISDNSMEKIFYAINKIRSTFNFLYLHFAQLIHTKCFQKRFAFKRREFICWSFFTRLLCSLF